jgi:AraC-like DNA-binding protein
VRCFTRRFGIAPHRYLVARCIEAARGRLLDGEPVAQVAAGVGFHDQAHLTRHFKRHVGTIPARYAASERAGLSPS